MEYHDRGTPFVSVQKFFNRNLRYSCKCFWFITFVKKSELGGLAFPGKHALFQSQSPLRRLSVLLKTAGCGRVSSRSGIRPKYSAGLEKTPELLTVNGICPLLEERDVLLQTLSCFFQLVQFVKCWQIFLELNSKKTVSKFRKRKRVAVFCSRPRQNVKLGTFTSVQQRQRTVLKRVMHVQSCCFANVNL